MKLDWKTIERPIIALSPMADMTDSPFCRTVKSLYPEPSAGGRLLVVFREMVSAEGIVRGNGKTVEMTGIHPEERPLIQQIFGSEPDIMAEAAKIVEQEQRPEGIDINMGCPVYKINKNFNGAALMKEPDRAAEIVRKIKNAVSLPVSVKIRAGWSDPTECIEFSRRMEDAGADLVTIHGRTKKQAYAGKSDWNIIRKARESVSVPVLANGDISSPELLFEALETTKCDGAMIARGALGNPWIFAQIEQMLRGEKPNEVTMEERTRVVRQHVRLHLERYGERGIITFRKHLSWYFRGMRDAKRFRIRLHTIKSLEKLDAVLDEIEAFSAVSSSRDN